MARIKLGDIFELETSRGKVYLHYVYKDKLMGALVRVLNGFYKETPRDFRDIVNHNEKFVTFFPLSSAVSQKIVKKVENIPLIYHKPLLMRSKHVVKGDFLGWHIINTETLQRELVKNLDDNQLKLSPWGICNDTFLIERLEQDWSLENWK